MSAMITLGDLLVVVVAVGIVASFFLTARRFVRRAQALEASEDAGANSTPR